METFAFSASGKLVSDQEMYVAAGDPNDKYMVQIGQGTAVDGTYPGYVVPTYPNWADALLVKTDQRNYSLYLPECLLGIGPPSYGLFAPNEFSNDILTNHILHTLQECTDLCDATPTCKGCVNYSGRYCRLYGNTCSYYTLSGSSGYNMYSKPIPS